VNNDPAKHVIDPVATCYEVIVGLVENNKHINLHITDTQYKTGYRITA
jgi:hypothetical protein